MASVVNEDSIEKKLRTVTNTQDSIQTLSLWIIHHKSNHAKIVELWMKVLKKSVSPAHRLTLFYLCNDVVQNCKKKKAFIYNTTFKECLREAASLVRDATVKGKVERIFNIWGERGVYDTTFIKSLHSVLNGQQVKTFKVRENLKDETKHRSVSEPHSEPDVVSQPHTQPDNGQHADMDSKDAVGEQQTGLDPEESARILAEFKPSDMIDQVTAFLRQEVEIKSKASKLSHLKIDNTSFEAVKQLKDRSVGNNFSSQCDEACSILEDVIKRQTSHIEDRQTLLDTLSLSELFYEEQYREAKIVANAYRNFGARINNMKKKLDELKKSLPEPDSPILSPDVNAPSPENTPPFVGICDYSNSPPSLGNYTNSPPAPTNYPERLLQKAWLYGDTQSADGVDSVIDDMELFPDSLSLEAPSPEGSPPDLNQEASGNASGSLDSRLASFFHRNPLDTPSKVPVYTPHRPLSVVTSTRAGEDDGSTTPLDDEAPTTPVQDEHLASPPKRGTPPKKENPIDFLSRLISQTQKVPPVKSGTQSFLDSLTRMTMVSKKPETSAQNPQLTAAPPTWTTWVSTDNKKPETSAQNAQLTAAPPTWTTWTSTDNKKTDTSAQNAQLTAAPPTWTTWVSTDNKKTDTSAQNAQLTAAPPTWTTWVSTDNKKTDTSAQNAQLTAAPPTWTTWTSTDNKTSSSQPLSPSSYLPSSSLPSSSATVSSVLPMVPPPMPIPVPPPPSLSTGLSMPPPPPPFVLVQALTPNFTSPPPNFQQTSPGQKENWPDIQHGQTRDHANSIRATHSSVLKELVPADGLASKAGLHEEHTAMDTGNDDEDNATLRSNVETVVDASTEFGQKLKQKTSHAALKCHVFVPNPERPNLMTLTVSDDLDEADMIDNDTVVEENTPWSGKPDGPVVRSRSQSREKDTSFQQAPMDNWSRDDVDGPGSVAGDSNPISNISSVVKQVEPFPRNHRNSNNGGEFHDRLGKNSNYWRQIDHKFDQFYKRGSRGRGNFRPFQGNTGFKDGVQAYTQAYKQAFQQYSQAPLIPFFPGPRPMNPRQPGYRQY